MGLVYVFDQDYLGRSPAECSQSRVILPGNGHKSCHRETLPWRFHWQTVGKDHLVGQEVERVERCREDAIGGGPQVTAVRLRRTAEVTPTGVGVHAAGRPRHRVRLWTSRYIPPGHVHTSTIPGRRIGNPGAGGHPYASKEAGLSLLDPTNTVSNNWKESCVNTAHLAAGLRGQEDFRTEYHASYMR